MKGSTSKTVVDFCRGAQVILGVAILALSVNLTVRWADVNGSCPKHAASDSECDYIGRGLGALKYCIFVGVWTLVDVGIWLIDSYAMRLPWFVVVGADQMAAGFALGGGSTLVALVDGSWSCPSGQWGQLLLCHQLYGDAGAMFVATLVGWTAVGAYCHWKRSAKPFDANSHNS